MYIVQQFKRGYLVLVSQKSAKKKTHTNEPLNYPTNFEISSNLLG